MTAILNTNKISLNFGGVTAVKDLTFELRQNEILSIIGPNGAGKTSVFNTISGLYEPTGGDIHFQKKPLKSVLGTKDYLKIILIAACSAVLIQVVYNLQSLWNASITANYLYLQPFDWSKAVSDAFKFILDTNFTPAIAGFMVVFALCLSFARSRTFSTFRIAIQGISRTFQNIRLFPELSVEENLLLSKFSEGCCSTVLSSLRLPRHRKEKLEKLELVGQSLKKTRIEALADKLICSLSYGDQRRVEIARALVTSPKVILLDEPAAGMNPTESHELMEVIRSIKEMGIGVILIEHHMKVVMGISDRILVLDRGELIAEGTPEEIKNNPKVISAYLGSESHDL